MRPKTRAIAIWLLLLCLCAGIIARTQFRTDMAAFLPRTAPMAQRVLADQVSKGAASHLIMLALSGAPPPVLAALSEQLAATLRAQPEFIDVLNGDAQSFAAVQDFIWRNRYLLSPDITPARFTAAGLHQALTNDLGLLGTDLAPMLQQSLPQDPTGEIFGLSRQQIAGPRSENNVWVSPDGASALLLVHARAPGFDIDAQQQALARINADFAAAKVAVPGAQQASLQESGPGVFAVAARDTTKRDVTRLSILASAGAVALLVFAYRAPLVVVLGLLPVASGALAGIATVSLVFGFVHGITVGFGVTLIGESLDYAIYLFTQTARGSTAQETLARIWPVLRLGVLTSIVGFSAMLFSDFTGFAQLGLFSIAGLAASSATTRFVLPHLVPRGFFAGGAAVLAAPLRLAMRHGGPVRLAILAVTAASALLLLSHRGGFWAGDINALSPIPVAAQQRDAMLRHDLAVPDARYFVVFQAATAQNALVASEALATVLNQAAAVQMLGGFDVPSAILPSDQAQRARQAALPDAATLAANLAQALQGLPFNPGTFTPFQKDAAAAKAAPLLRPASLPPPLALRLDSMLMPDGALWDVIVPLRGVAAPAKIAALVAQSGPQDAAFIDLNNASGQLLGKFQSEASTLAVAGSLAILLMLLAGLRSIRHAARVAAPLAAAVLVTAAALTMNGGKISIFEVTGFLLIIAVGSNYCLFFASMARPAPGGAQAGERAVASIVLANLCTVCAYGLMAFSTIPVLHDIGETVAIGAFLSLCFAALLSPHPAVAA